MEDRYGRVFALPHVAGATVDEALAELQARQPQIAVVFAEIRPLAQEGSYRWLGAYRAELLQRNVSEESGTFRPAGPAPAARRQLRPRQRSAPGLHASAWR
ncbi:hypothetical protein ABLG96_00990 [Nakamurella sp. A5-74]|uniref:Uncharacterized protein n=1 Tax=Nakamurella sp. A5-74 TaxID=3158264 RepID=A0AAU8DV47_9ACTN